MSILLAVSKKILHPPFYILGSILSTNTFSAARISANHDLGDDMFKGESLEPFGNRY